MCSSVYTHAQESQIPESPAPMSMELKASIFALLSELEMSSGVKSYKLQELEKELQEVLLQLDSLETSKRMIERDFENFERSSKTILTQNKVMRYAIVGLVFGTAGYVVYSQRR